MVIDYTEGNVDFPESLVTLMQYYWTERKSN